ncbi:hypothetical protein ABGN05_10185 [Aquibium sp. LZ166]|uniref:Uncharacterized protein n=1 Tax=Aquibium pacificus TaxID=3153579 RepID=A0ABV3SH27_9HYPH
MTASHLELSGFLPHLDAASLLARLKAAPGNEIDSGKFASPESSAALAVNFFGWFCLRGDTFPGFPGLPALDRPVRVDVERCLRFPWSGGRHPWLDAVIETPKLLIGVESKRYEPFRTKAVPTLSEAYRRRVWGDRMAGFEAVRDGLMDGSMRFDRLDAAQLVKHALGLRTQAAKSGKLPTLVYLHAEPTHWPDGRAISSELHAAHRNEIADFAQRVDGDEVSFVSVSYASLLAYLAASPDEDLRRHGAAVGEAFAPL